MQLLLLPGLDASGRLYDELTAELPDSYRLTALAYPTDRALNYDALLELVRDSVPNKEPWALIGESFSGPLAIRLAAERPHGLAALILCATFVCRPVPIPAWMVWSPLFWIPAPAFVMRHLMFEPSVPAQPVTQFMEALGAVDADVLAARGRAALSVDVRSDLDALSLPVLYLKAQNDRLFGPDVHGTVLRHCPTMHTITVANAPHLLLQREPKAAAKAITQWLDRLGTR